MIAIGCVTTDERAFRAHGAVTISTLDEGSSLLLRQHDSERFDGPYNEMLGTAAAREQLEAVVLVHQNAVVVDDDRIAARIRRLLAASSEIAVLGSVAGGAPRETAAVDGTLLVLSPWAVRTLRFDAVAGYSVDACARDISLQARASGQRVVAAPLGVRARGAALRQPIGAHSWRRWWSCNASGTRSADLRQLRLHPHAEDRRNLPHRGVARGVGATGDGVRPTAAGL